MKKNIVGWFEIPVQNLDRAARFYEAVFNLSLERVNMGEQQMAWFPGEDSLPGSSGALVLDTEVMKPSPNGVLVYFRSPSGDCAKELDKVEQAGGVVLQARTLIAPEFGYYGLILDSEGNRIGIHSQE